MKSPFNLKRTGKESAAVPVFLIVTHCIALTDPTEVTGKLTVIGVIDATANPAACDCPLAAKRTVKLVHNKARGESSNDDILSMKISPSHLFKRTFLRRNKLLSSIISPKNFSLRNNQLQGCILKTTLFF
ncbi:hypothetical protein ACFOFO_14710 [Undibacterium arcticum]|uniref:Uncharacterized protein n=1 Tax=Undibacterium arcticum TaxID=1762892 RepID=A0ABV7F4W0_9BURK